MHMFFGEHVEIPGNEAQARLIVQVLADAVEATRAIQVGSITHDLARLNPAEMYLMLAIAVQTIAGTLPPLPAGDPVLWRDRFDRTR